MLAQSSVPSNDRHPAAPSQPSDACGPRALCGWSPPARTADTPAKGRVDRYVLANRTAIGVFVAVIVLLNLAPHLSYRASLGVDALAGLLAGGWCTANYWRCRHAHCLITGPGWLAWTAFVLVEAALGRSLIGGDEQLAFLAILAIGVGFEALWYATRRSHAIAQRTP